MNLVDGQTYLITSFKYEDEPQITIQAVWNERHKTFDTDKGWFGLCDVALVKGEAKNV